MIKILENTPQNVSQVANIESACFGDEAWNINLVQSEFDCTLSTFVAYIVSNTVVGYASFRAVLDEMQVGNVAVLPQYRRQGIARQLVNHCKQLAKSKGCTVAELEVNTANLGAVGLYQGCGFTVVSTRKNYYPKSNYPSKDAYLMTATL